VFSAVSHAHHLNGRGSALLNFAAVHPLVISCDVERPNKFGMATLAGEAYLGVRDATAFAQVCREVYQQQRSFLVILYLAFLAVLRCEQPLPVTVKSAPFTIFGRRASFCADSARARIRSRREHHVSRWVIRQFHIVFLESTERGRLNVTGTDRQPPVGRTCVSKRSADGF